MRKAHMGLGGGWKASSSSVGQMHHLPIVRGELQSRMHAQTKQCNSLIRLADFNDTNRIVFRETPLILYTPRAQKTTLRVSPKQWENPKVYMLPQPVSSLHKPWCITKAHMTYTLIVEKALPLSSNSCKKHNTSRTEL